MRLHLPVEQTVLHGLGDVGFIDAVFAVEIGDGAGETADLVVGAGAEAKPGDCLPEESEGSFGHGCELIELFSAEACVCGCGALSCGGSCARFAGGVAHCFGVRAAGDVCEFFEGDGGCFDVDIDAVEERAREFAEVLLHLAAADLARGDIASRGWVHRGDEHE